MPTSWQVRLAALLVGGYVVVGAGMLALAGRLLRGDPGLLFAVLPFVAAALAAGGLILAVGALTLSVRLWTGAKGARMQTALLGGLLAVFGLMGLTVQVWVGLLLAVQGLALVALMSTAAAKQDLDGWLDGFKRPAPWGSTPGTGMWSDAPVQQGPWSPDPTTVPWLPSKGASGPQVPWWQTWRAALEQGIPMWEALLLGLALVGWAVGLVLVFIGFVHHAIGPVPSLLVAGSIGVAWLLEQRMRTRLAGRDKRSGPQASA